MVAVSVGKGVRVGTCVVGNRRVGVSLGVFDATSVAVSVLVGVRDGRTVSVGSGLTVFVTVLVASSVASIDETSVDVRVARWVAVALLLG